MIKSQLCILASTLTLLAWAPHAGARGPGSPAAPVIESVEIDSAQQRLTMNGNFFGVKKPQLTLGKHRLEVSESSMTQVVANLPPNLLPATYRLSINNASSAAVNTASLYLKIPQKSDPTQVASITAISPQ